MFNALVLDRSDGRLSVGVRELAPEDLPEAGPNEVYIDVLYSSLNYKDALAVTGAGKIIRGGYPIVPGIDMVGRILEGETDELSPGDLVIGTGWQLGEVHWGGYTQRARVEGSKLVALPDGLTPKQAMIAGTAGFTAMLGVMALEDHNVTPEQGDVVVTGASGGAGSMAITILDSLGYDVVASSGSADAHDYLQDRGADRIVSRAAFEDGPERPLESGKWAGAIDAVGGKTLAALISQLKRHGSIASVGNAGGHKLETSVLPFILRGVNLLGIDSNTCPTDRRELVWRRLASTLDETDFDEMTARVIGLKEIPDASQALLDGTVQGRILVNVNA